MADLQLRYIFILCLLLLHGTDGKYDYGDLIEDDTKYEVAPGLRHSRRLADSESSEAKPEKLVPVMRALNASDSDSAVGLNITATNTTAASHTHLLFTSPSRGPMLSVDNFFPWFIYWWKRAIKGSMVAYHDWKSGKKFFAD